MKITDFIEGKVTYDNYGQYFWVNDASEGQQMLAELRGWGRIQNMFQSKGKYDLEGAEKFQDELGEWVASAINEKLQRESEQILLNKPAVSKSVGDERRALLVSFARFMEAESFSDTAMTPEQLVDEFERNQ